MRIGSGAQRCGDRREIDQLTAPECPQPAHDAGRDEDRPNVWIITVRAQHRQTRNVLGRHGHHEQRDGDPDDRVEVERGRDEDGIGQRIGEQIGRQIGGDGDHHGGDGHCDRHGPEARETEHQRPNEHNGQRERWQLRHRAHGRQTQIKEDTGQHCTGERHRYGRDGAAEALPAAGDDNQTCRNDERARGRGKSAGDAARRDQECCPGCRPGDRQRYPGHRAQDDADDAYAQRQREQTGGRLFLSGAQCRKSLQDNGKRAGKTHH